MTGSAATLNPTCPVLLAGSLPLRAATRYRSQYYAWHRNEPPRITRCVPVSGPVGARPGERA